MTRLYLQGSPDQKLCKELIHWLEQDKGRAVYILDEGIPNMSITHPRMHPFCIRGVEGEAILRKIAWEGVFLPSTLKKIAKRGPLDQLKQIQEEVHSFASDFGDLGIQVARNLLDNLKQMDSLYLARDLKNAYQKMPAVICGAGPSLEQEIDWLKEVQDQVLIFTGGAGITALEHFNVTPHFIGGIDPHPAKERLHIKRSNHLPFFFQGRVASDLLKHMKGPKIWVSSSGHFPMETWIADCLGLPEEPFDGGWNVATFLTALACDLGCDPVILVGVDLSGDGYAGQVIDERGSKRDWKMAAKWLDQFKKTHPQVRDLRGRMVKEPVAKLHGSEKSMILAPVERLGNAWPIRIDGGLPKRAGEEIRSQQGPKGRFCTPWSFATGSKGKAISSSIQNMPFRSWDFSTCHALFLESLKRVMAACERLIHPQMASDILMKFELEEEPAYQMLCLPVWEVWQHVFKREVSSEKDLEIHKWLMMRRICHGLI